MSHWWALWFDNNFIIWIYSGRFNKKPHIIFTEFASLTIVHIQIEYIVVLLLVMKSKNTAAMIQTVMVYMQRAVWVGAYDAPTYCMFLKFLFFLVRLIAFSGTVLPLLNPRTLCLQAFQIAPLPLQRLQQHTPESVKRQYCYHTAESTVYPVTHLWNHAPEHRHCCWPISQYAIGFQQGTGDSGISLVSVLFLVCCCYILGVTQKGSSLSPECVPAPEVVIKHLILWVADYSLYPDVCADTNLSKHKTRGPSVFTISPNFALLFPSSCSTTHTHNRKWRKISHQVWQINI